MQKVSLVNRTVAKQCDTLLRGKLVLFVFLLIATAGIALYYGVIDLPLRVDNQHYFYMSERVASGVSPYTSHFDPKHALSMFLTGAAIFVGRTIGISDIASARLLSLFILAVSIWLIWILTYHLTKSPRAAVLACLAMFTFSGYIYMGVIGSRPKVFMVLFMLSTMIFFNQGKLFWSGVSASLAFLCWQPALLMMGTLVFVLLLHQKRFYKISCALLGATLPLLVYQLYFVITDSLKEQLTQTYYFPAKFMVNNFSGFLTSLKELVNIWEHGFGTFNILPLICAFGVLSYSVSIFRKGRIRSLFANIDPGWLYVSLCMLGCFTFTFYEHQGYPDIFFVLPFIAIISAYSLGLLIENMSRFRNLVYGLIVSYLMVLIVYIPSRYHSQFTLADQLQLASEVRQMLDNNETVYAIGCTHLLAFNSSENWMKYGFFFRGVNEFIADETGVDTFMPVKEGTMPSIILLSRRPPRGSKNWLDSLYINLTTSEFKHQKIRVFKLNKQEKIGHGDKN
ncbi:MAG: DolP-mannose mannosyltransferase [Candidatus Omnitrophica bacterium]|nr:DolP-mannose mannosyltransferase [Candidatus Omnitrophota bacterium]